MDYGIRGKLAIVTGGGAGLGRAVALALADEGANLAIFDIDETHGQETAQLVNERGVAGRFYKVDVTANEQVVAAVKSTIQESGAIDILINNAGLVDYQGPWHLLPEESFDRVVGVNFKGQYLVAKAVVNQMIKQKSGRIVNTASVAAKVGEPNNGVYSCTKATAVSMTQSMAQELGKYGITVNAVNPAAMPTELMEKVYAERAEHFGLTPEQLRDRIAGIPVLPGTLSCEDVANVYVFLVSNQTKMMTGQNLTISAGAMFC